MLVKSQSVSSPALRLSREFDLQIGKSGYWKTNKQKNPSKPNKKQNTWAAYMLCWSTLLEKSRCYNEVFLSQTYFFWKSQTAYEDLNIV